MVAKLFDNFSMALRELCWMNYNHGFWLGAVRVKEEEIEIGDILCLADRKRLGRYPYPVVVEVRVVSLNSDGTATVILRGGGVENVRLDKLRRPDWWTTPRYWYCQGPRCIPRLRMPTHKDEMLKHGVAIAGDPGIDDGHRDVTYEDYVASMEARFRPRVN